MKLSVAIVLLCAVTGIHSTPYISFMGETLRDHGFVDLSLVGNVASGRDSVQCHTDVSTCCEPTAAGNESDVGNWFAPTENGSRPLHTDRAEEMYVVYGEQRIDLRQRNAGKKSGMYRCEIQTGHSAANSVAGTIGDFVTLETVYVGLYANGGGAVMMVESMTITLERHDNRPQFTLTCRTRGGPATAVIWIRNTARSNGLTNSVLNDPITAEYTHTLKVNGRPSGRYMCIVTNNKPSRADDTFDIEENLFRVRVVSSSSTTVELSLSLARDVIATTYTISYSNTDNTDCFTDSRVVTGIRGSERVYILTGLQEGTRYSVDVTATMSNRVTIRKSVSASTASTAPSAAPSYINVTDVTNSSISVQWGPVECIHSNAPVTGYVVQYGKKGSGIKETVNVTGNETIISGLTPLTNYTVNVTAFNIFGIGPYGTIAVQTLETVTVSEESVSLSPKSVSATSLSLSLTLNEERLTVTNYSISYSNTDSDCFVDSGNITGIPGDQGLYTLTGLQEGTEYSLSVTATFSSGESLRKALTTITSEAGPSVAPNAVNASQVTSSSLTVQWEPVECVHRNGALTGYSVMYGVVGSETAQTVNVTQDVYFTTITGLLPGTEYKVQVAAVNSISEGPYSDPIQVFTHSQQSITVVQTPVTTAQSESSYIPAVLMSGFLGFLVGVIVTLLATICVLAVLYRCKTGPKSDMKDYTPGKDEVMLKENEAYSSVMSVPNRYQEEVIYEHVI